MKFTELSIEMPADVTLSQVLEALAEVQARLTRTYEKYAHGESGETCGVMVTHKGEVSWTLARRTSEPFA